VGGRKEIHVELPLLVSKWTFPTPCVGELAGSSRSTPGSQVGRHVGGQQPGVPGVRVRCNFLLVLAITHVVVPRIKVLLSTLKTKDTNINATSIPTTPGQ